MIRTYVVNKPEHGSVKVFTVISWGLSISCFGYWCLCWQASVNDISETLWCPCSEWSDCHQM